jgi:hypothetical protein
MDKMVELRVCMPMYAYVCMQIEERIGQTYSSSCSFLQSGSAQASARTPSTPSPLFPSLRQYTDRQTERERERERKGERRGERQTEGKQGANHTGVQTRGHARVSLVLTQSQALRQGGSAHTQTNVGVCVHVCGCVCPSLCASVRVCMRRVIGGQGGP